MAGLASGTSPCLIRSTVVSGFRTQIHKGNSLNTVHGCVLRLARPGEVKSYLVDPVFPKRADSKNAVSLLAMTQGVGQWIRTVARECEEKMPPRLKEYITTRVVPMIHLEYSKIWPGRHPDIYTYTKDHDGETQFECIVGFVADCLSKRTVVS